MKILIKIKKEKPDYCRVFPFGEEKINKKNDNKQFNILLWVNDIINSLQNKCENMNK